MPRDHRTSKAEFPLAEAQRLYQQHRSYQKVADAIGWSFSQTRRNRQAAVNREPTIDLAPTSNGTPTTTLQRVELVGEPVSADNRVSNADLKAQLDVLAAEVADLKAHRLEVDAHLATLQAQSRATAQPRAALRRPTQSLRTRGLTPDDAKSVPFNLSLPRGLKRLLDAEAKRTGFPASRLVQKLLMAALVGQDVGDDA